MNVHNAFLHGDLDEEVYMNQSPSFSSTPGKFMQDPRVEHWDAALHVVRYLKGSSGQGILHPDCALQLTGWCDSLTRRSLTGWIVFLGSSRISWKTKKQPTVSRSSAEVEYRSMTSITCELKWLKGLFSMSWC